MDAEVKRVQEFTTTFYWSGMQSKDKPDVWLNYGEG